MPPIRIAIYDAKGYDKHSFEQALTEDNLRGQFEFVYLEPRLNIDTVNFCTGCDAICAFVNDNLDTSVIAALDEKGIALVLMRCAGFDRVDLNACHELQISVTRVPAYSPYAVAEFATALLLSVVRKTHKAYNRIRDSNFTLSGLVGFDIHGKTVGVVGTGRIGQCFIDIMLGFGCDILAYDLYPNEALKSRKGVKYVTIEELFQKSDIISLHAPLTKATEHLVNRCTINTMKVGVIILNTSRGKLIDGKALVEGLVCGRIGGAGLDVYENEESFFFRDVSEEHIDDDVLARLQNMRNVVFTSHQAFLTHEALKAIAQTTIASIREFFIDRKRLHDLTYHIPLPEASPALVKALSRRLSLSNGKEENSHGA